MTYKVIGVMSGSSLDGLDIVYAHYFFVNQKWSFEIKNFACQSYNEELSTKLRNSTLLPVYDFLRLDVELGLEIGKLIKDFIVSNHLDFQVDFVVVHGHTTFHNPSEKITHQLGDIHAIASCVRLPVIHQLRSMDVMLGGQGAPIVPLGEKLLFSDHTCFLNLGGIANIAFHYADEVVAYDICSANAVLNYLAQKIHLPFDKNGQVASSGKINKELLTKLETLDYYAKPYPKSLSNQWAKENVIPILEQSSLSVEDLLRTYSEHIAIILAQEVAKHKQTKQGEAFTSLVITGGGAFNIFLIQTIQNHLRNLHCDVFLPAEEVIKFKEAIIMGLLGILRWRLEPNVLKSVTGAKENTINGVIAQSF